MKFWFVTGSQFLYGEETLRQVEEDSIRIVNELELPFPVEYKLTIKTAAEVEKIVKEANYDDDMLRKGPYPYYLKERIAGPRGHLSNDDAARFAAEMALCGTKEIVLAHLSRENNTPQRALDTVQRALEAAGLSPRLSVAPRKETSTCYEVEAGLCRK